MVCELTFFFFIKFSNIWFEITYYKIVQAIINSSTYCRIYLWLTTCKWCDVAFFHLKQNLWLCATMKTVLCAVNRALTLMCWRFMDTLALKHDALTTHMQNIKNKMYLALGKINNVWPQTSPPCCPTLNSLVQHLKWQKGATQSLCTVGFCLHNHRDFHSNLYIGTSRNGKRFHHGL